MPRRGHAPKKMDPTKKGASKNIPTSPTPPDHSPNEEQDDSKTNTGSDLMNSEISSEISSNEQTTVVPLAQRKSPRLGNSSAGVANDDGSMSQTGSTETSGTSGTGSQESQHRRKSPAPLKKLPPHASVLREIVKLQQSTAFVIPKLSFARLIREILMQYNDRGLRITAESLLCLQESAEIFAVQLMEDAYRCTLHRERVTLMPKDMKLAVMLRKDSVLI